LNGKYKQNFINKSEKKNKHEMTALEEKYRKLETEFHILKEKQLADHQVLIRSFMEKKKDGFDNFELFL
jgi:hypothetical protein